MNTNLAARYYRVVLVICLISLYYPFFNFHAKVTRAASSCVASVTPSSVQPNTQDITFGYLITNTGLSTTVWIKIIRPTFAITWKSFQLDGWTKGVSEGEFLLTANEDTLPPGKTRAPEATVNIGDAGGFSGDWVIKVSDDAGGANPSSCSGSLGLTISSGAPDTTPPVISGISTTDITSTSVKISWGTNEKATSKVEYGLESGIYSLSKGSSTLTTSHSLTLTEGIGAEATYYYRVYSTDAAGNQAWSNENSFTTAISSPTSLTPASSPKTIIKNITDTASPVVSILTDLPKPFARHPFALHRVRVLPPAKTMTGAV